MPSDPYSETSTQPDDRPWIPTQLFGAGFLFGGLAGGILSAINFRRLGSPGLVVPSILAGVVVAALVLVCICFVSLPDTALRVVGLLVALLTGAGFYLGQRQAFTDWYERHYEGQPLKEYRPNRLGLL